MYKSAKRDVEGAIGPIHPATATLPVDLAGHEDSSQSLSPSPTVGQQRPHRSEPRAIDPNRLYSIAEARAFAGCSRETIRQKIKNKKLAAARIDKGPWKIPGDSLINLVAPLTAIQPTTVPTDSEITARWKKMIQKWHQPTSKATRAAVRKSLPE